MKGNEANRSRRAERWTEGRDELLTIRSDHVIVMPLCEMRSRFSYLAVHEFKVDPFQCDLQQSTFTSFHVLDGKLSAQLRT